MAQIAEAIVRRHLEAKGLIVYEPVTGKAHPFDKLCAARDKRTLVIAEVKAKPSRRFFPDTGINLHHWEEYREIRKKHRIEVLIYFVDEDAAAIYGNKLSILEEPRVVEDNHRTLRYPLVQNGIIYFPLAAMQVVAHLNDAEVDALAALSTRDGKYVEQPRPPAPPAP